MTPKAFEELAAIAGKLNAESNDLNKTITSLNARFAEINVGVEVWLPLSQGGLRYNRRVSPPEKYEENTFLGYGKVGPDEKWQLAVREDTLTYNWDNDEKEEYVVTESDCTPLLKASRDIRIQAMELVPELLEALKRAAQEKLRIIQGAKKLAAEL
jgi:hypothetical protein